MMAKCIGIAGGAATILLFAACGWGATRAAVSKPLPTKRITYAKYVATQSSNILTSLEKTGNYRIAIKQSDGLFDQTVAYAPGHAVRSIVQVDYVRRLVRQLAAVKSAAHRAELLGLLTKNQELAETLAFLLETHRQPMELIYHRLYKMHQALGNEIFKYPNVTAALCVTLYKPFHRHLNENLVTSPSPNALFKYYVRYRRLMYFGIKNVPARLLVYVVDDCASIKEMTWALKRYHGDPLVGQLFFDIRYDYAALAPGAIKRVDRAGYNLPNILKYGGICIDQAYFASAVGKAIGVPTAIDEGMSSVVGHAWVGFLQAHGEVGWWNFNVGRYSEYQGVIGMVKNPLTREREPDDFMSISAQLIHTTQRNRWAAVALTDCARRLLAIQLNHIKVSPAAPPKKVRGARAVAWKNSSHLQLQFLGRAVRQCLGYADAWRTVAVMAHLKQLTLGEKEQWSEKLMKLCGRQYPDFALAILTPMINSVKNIHRRVQMWNRVFPWFADTRFDLAARIRMMQATDWESAHKDNRAGRYLMFVINQYTNAGPFVITALQKATQILARQGHKNQILTLYEQTWLHIKPPPTDMLAFESESSWYRVGKTLEHLLRAQGHGRLADKVALQLHAGGTNMRNP